MSVAAFASHSAHTFVHIKGGMGPKKKSGKSTKSGGHKLGSRPPGSRKDEALKAKARRLEQQKAVEDGRQ